MTEQHVTVNSADDRLSVEMMVSPDELDFLWRLDQFGLIILGKDYTK